MPYLETIKKLELDKGRFSALSTLDIWSWQGISCKQFDYKLQGQRPCAGGTFTELRHRDSQTFIRPSADTWACASAWALTLAKERLVHSALDPKSSQPPRAYKTE
jgi:hypothetical protein